MFFIVEAKTFLWHFVPHFFVQIVSFPKINEFEINR